MSRQCAYTLCTMHDLLLLLQLFYLHYLHCLHCLHSAAMVGGPMALLAPPCVARALVGQRVWLLKRAPGTPQGNWQNTIVW